MTNFEKLQKLLEELFQLDQADLDFGIYRIMNQKRDEVVRFLEKDLLPQVKAAFGHYKSADKSQIQKELDKLTQQIEAAGMNPDDSPKVQELKTQMADSSVDVTMLENEVFSHLFNFFRRYYHEGDFISLRRYKEGVYAIPYEGEEVKLHWANHDQYYVKSSEYFRDYIFTMPSGKRVRVHLVAASSEQDNKKEAPGKERRFIICAEDPIYEENGELFIRFEYKPDDGKKKQDALNQEAIERVLKAEGFDEWTRELSKPAPTKSNPKRTVLEKHLTQYTARNTFDYFIHKDLGGFLRRELDFYIKNEVMHLDDIEHDTVPRVEQYLSKIKVIRKIAHKVIQFLEQLENFQKKLWLKKKFVVETNYCITLDRVPEELYPEIAANDAQREEWVRLYAIDCVEPAAKNQSYSVPLTTSFLKANTSLMLDTAFFNREFVSRLLSSIDDVDGITSGVIVNGENFHALMLFSNRLKNHVDMIYVDPPYNTGSDGFCYKDMYQHSSWASMIFDRFRLGYNLLASSGFFWSHIDCNESWTLRGVCDAVFGLPNFVNEVLWKRRGGSSNPSNQLGIITDTIYLYKRSAESQLSSVFTKDSEEAKQYIIERFTEIDESGRKYMKSPIVSPNYRENLCYDYKGYKHPPNGWSISQDIMEEWDRNGKLYFPKRGERIYRKIYLDEYPGQPIQNLWLDIFVINPMAHERVEFSTQKPISLIKRMMLMTSDKRSCVLDFFAGSGTTGHAVINLNREDGGTRKYFLVEVGAHFDTVLKPRLQRVVYSDVWRDGKPVSRTQGLSHCFKYIRLESYEDALNNLSVKRSQQQDLQLEHDDDLREQYILSYMLDVECRGSQSLLNVESFRDPDQYKLRIDRNGETQLVNVDLIETFNWLLGLTVKHISVVPLKKGQTGVRVVEGMNLDGDRVLVLWRNLDETDNDTLDEWFKKQDYNTKDQEYDLIYVNGDNNLENLRRGDQTWKVRLIEEEFQQLMFDVEDV